MWSSFFQSNAVSVITDRPFYYSGDPVNGYVLLNCVKAFDCSQVLLKVEAYEKVSWEERQEDTTYDDAREETLTTERYVPFMGEKDFFKVSVPLSQFKQHCEPGQYQFPFAFVLPHGLPGSFEYKDTQHFYAGIYYNYTKAKIKYKIKAECVVPGMLKPNVRGKAYLTVHQRLAKAPTETKASHTQSVTSCCCSDTGSCTVRASVQKDSYIPGETACILFEVENNSSAEFSAVHLALRRRVELAGGGRVQRLDDDAAKLTTEGVPASVSFVGKEARSLQLPLPSNLLPSTVGELIQCEYVLVVTLKASTFVSNVELKVPVLIYMPQPEGHAYAQPPPEWHATQIAPPVELELPSAPPMPPKAQDMTAAGHSDANYRPDNYMPPTYQGPPK